MSRQQKATGARTPRHLQSCDDSPNRDTAGAEGLRSLGSHQGAQRSAPTLARMGIRERSNGTWSGPLSNIFRVRGNCWEWGVYCTPVGPGAPGRPAGRSRPTGCFVTSLVRLELLALDVGGEPLPLGEETLRFTQTRNALSSHRPPRSCPWAWHQEPKTSSLAQHVPMPGASCRSRRPFQDLPASSSSCLSGKWGEPPASRTQLSKPAGALAGAAACVCSQLLACGRWCKRGLRLLGAERQGTDPRL